MIILVLGVYTDDCQPFGGIIDLDKLTDSEDDKIILNAINKALNADKFFIITDTGYGNTTKYESMPYTGIVDAEVYIYVE